MRSGRKFRRERLCDPIVFVASVVHQKFFELRSWIANLFDVSDCNYAAARARITSMSRIFNFNASR